MGKARIFSGGPDSSDQFRESAASWGNRRANAAGISNATQGGISGLKTISTTAEKRDTKKLSLKGGKMIGAIGFKIALCKIDTVTKTLDLAIDASGNPLEVVPGAVIAVPSTGTTASLDKIVGRARDGQLLYILGRIGDTLTITHTAAATDDTLTTPTDTDIIMTDDQVMVVIHDITSNKWRVIRDPSAVTPGADLDEFRTWKADVRLVDVVGGTLSTAFENGDTVDGVTLSTGDRLLLTGQTSAVENGIYTVNASGAPTRATDFDADSEATDNPQCHITAGDRYANSDWRLDTAAPTIGTTGLTFTERVSGWNGEIGKDADLNGNDINDVDILRLAATGTDTFIRKSGTEFQLKSASSSTFDFYINGNKRYQMTDNLFICVNTDTEIQGMNKVIITGGSGATNNLALADAFNIDFGGNTGTKIGGTGSKLALYGNTPIARQAHITDPTGGATIDAEARTAINSILAQMDNIGIQDPS